MNLKNKNLFIYENDENMFIWNKINKFLATKEGKTKEKHN
jgi:hypothetical protein